VRISSTATPLTGRHPSNDSPVAWSQAALTRFLNCPWLHSHAHLSAGTTLSSRRSLSCVECLRVQHTTRGMASIHSFIGLWFASCTAAAVFHRRGSANESGEPNPSSSRAASYLPMLTKPSSPLYQRHSFHHWDFHGHVYQSGGVNLIIRVSVFHWVEWFLLLQRNWICTSNWSSINCMATSSPPIQCHTLCTECSD
jgi:hypothetical protein